MAGHSGPSQPIHEHVNRIARQRAADREAFIRGYLEALGVDVDEFLTAVAEYDRSVEAWPNIGEQGPATEAAADEHERRRLEFRYKDAEGNVLRTEVLDPTVFSATAAGVGMPIPERARTGYLSPTVTSECPGCGTRWPVNRYGEPLARENLGGGRYIDRCPCGATVPRVEVPDA